MSDELHSLREKLLQGQKLSKQTSYERRAPHRKAVPYLRDALAGLRAYVKLHDHEAEGWRLLSQVEECMLNYRAARKALERAMSLGGTRDKKYLKRLTLLKEYEDRWGNLALSPEQLAALGGYLQSCLEATPCDHTLRHTEVWLQRLAGIDMNDTREQLRDQGGYCDCEVLANVVRD